MDDVLERRKLLKSTYKKPDLKGCLWSSKPYALSYFGNYLLIPLTVIVIFITICAILVPQDNPIGFLFLPSIFCFIFIIKYSRCRYYITDSYIVIRKTIRYHYFPIKELRKIEFELKERIFDKLFHCKKIRYVKLQHSIDVDFWREISYFYCIRDYDKVLSILEYKAME